MPLKRLQPIPALSWFVLLLQGCSDFGSAPPPDLAPPNMQVSFSEIQITDAELLRVAYSAYGSPADFYREDLQDAYFYYVSNWDLSPANRRTYPVYELSTNRRDEARAWVESSAVHSSNYDAALAGIDSERETERFFEFRRHYLRNPRFVWLGRVHKLSYIDRSMYNLPSRAPLIGRLNARPVDDTTVKDLVGYLWFTERPGTKVLAAVTAGAADTVYCALYEADLAAGDYGVRDVVRLQRTEYAVSRANGDVLRRSAMLHYVFGEQH